MEVAHIHKVFQSPIGWGLSCEAGAQEVLAVPATGFNPLLVGV